MRTTGFAALAAIVLWALPLNDALAQEHGGQHAHGEKQPDQQKSGDKAKELPLCPVMGEPVDFSVKTMTEQGPVYFCCAPCIKKFVKEPARYATKVAAQRDALKKMERVQVTCPISGNPIDGKTQIVSRGKAVSFCCERCVSKFDSRDNTDADNRRLDAKLEECYTYQTRCPVSGDKIDPTAFTDLPTGQRIYLCCSGCGEKLLKQPAKYASKLAEQGVPIDPEKLSAGDPKSKPTERGEPKHP
ncbi:MAG: hypothetical protein AB7Q17_05705 [Phycisphaerae bacterium]